MVQWAAALKHAEEAQLSLRSLRLFKAAFLLKLDGLALFVRDYTKGRGCNLRYGSEWLQALARSPTYRSRFDGSRYT